MQARLHAIFFWWVLPAGCLPDLRLSSLYSDQRRALHSGKPSSTAHSLLVHDLLHLPPRGRVAYGCRQRAWASRRM